jgi:hypothetical protein
MVYYPSEHFLRSLHSLRSSVNTLFVDHCASVRTVEFQPSNCRHEVNHIDMFYVVWKLSESFSNGRYVEGSGLTQCSFVKVKESELVLLTSRR